MARVTEGRPGETFKFASRILAMPDPSQADYITASQAVERLRSGFAACFQQYDALLCLVTPVPAPPRSLGIGHQRRDGRGKAYPARHCSVQSDRASRPLDAVRHEQRWPAARGADRLAVARRQRCCILRRDWNPLAAWRGSARTSAIAEDIRYGPRELAQDLLRDGHGKDVPFPV